MLRGGIAERGGVRVGHRIIEINGQSVVAVPHERIVNLLATSVGEVKYFLNLFSEIFFLWPKFLDSHEDHADLDVPPSHRAGDSSLHIKLFSKNR